MTKFQFATNIECVNAAKAAQSATENIEHCTMGLIEALDRLYRLVPANDGVSRAVIIEPTDDKTEVWVSINKALPVWERRDTARALRPVIRAFGGRQVNRYRNGKRVLFDTWRIDAKVYREAIAARDFWKVEDSSLDNYTSLSHMA